LAQTARIMKMPLKNHRTKKGQLSKRKIRVSI
jgi:hypothetical protein